MASQKKGFPGVKVGNGEGTASHLPGAEGGHLRSHWGLAGLHGPGWRMASRWGRGSAGRAGDDRRPVWVLVECELQGAGKVAPRGDHRVPGAGTIVDPHLHQLLEKRILC